MTLLRCGRELRQRRRGAILGVLVRFGTRRFWLCRRRILRMRRSLAWRERLILVHYNGTPGVHGNGCFRRLRRRNMHPKGNRRRRRSLHARTRRRIRCTALLNRGGGLLNRSGSLRLFIPITFPRGWEREHQTS